VAAAAVALGKAGTGAFRAYAAQVLLNAKALAEALLEAGVSLVTGGTDNHMLVVDCAESFDLDGREAERVLDRIGITANKQVIPDDPAPPLRPSGIRLGTPAATTRGMREADMRRLAAWMASALYRARDEAHHDALRQEVEAHCARFPVPGLEPPGPH
jgi:glycine hydroxymethyltransferase